MTDNRERILKMLADDKITVEEATRLLARKSLSTCMS